MAKLFFSLVLEELAVPLAMVSMHLENVLNESCVSLNLHLV